jgi:hypothetical protein
MKRSVGVVVLLAGACAGPELELDDLTGGVGLEVPDQNGTGDALLSSRSSLRDPEAARMRDVCRDLVARSGVSTTSRCPVEPGDYGDLRLPGEAGCLRDAYVFTALAYCWRSLCLETQGVTEADALAGASSTSPLREARSATRMLAMAGQLCTQTQASCTTSAILSCPGS